MKKPRWLTESRWRVACFLGLGAVLNYADRSALSAVLVPLRKEFGLSDVRLGMLLSLFLWCYALASPFAGNFADRYSKIRLLFGSIAAWSIFTALIGAANGLVLLCVLSVGLGVAESIFNPAAFALVGDHHGPETRGTAMAILSVGAQFGVVAGGACAGFMAERYGWRTGFWALGAIGLVLALAARLVLVPGPGSASSAPQRAGFFEAMGYLVRVPSYLLVLAKQILAESATWMYFGWLPLYLYEEHHLGLAVASLVGMSILQVFMVIGMAVGGWLSDRAAGRGAQGRMMAFAWCYLLACPFPLIFVGRPGLVVVTLAISACSLFRGLGSANERPIVCDVVPVRFRSTAYGLMNLCATAAGAVGVLYAGAMKEHFGLKAAFASVSVPFLVTAVALFIGYRVFMPRDMERCREFEAQGAAGV